MRWPISIIVLVGLFHASDAAPKFNETDVIIIKDALSAIPEDFNNFTSVIGTRLHCYHDDPNVTSRLRLKLMKGDNFVSLTPQEFLWRPYGDIKIKRAANIDFETTTDGGNQQNSKVIEILCEAENGDSEDVFTQSLVITDVNDNEPVFERNNITYQTSIEEIMTGDLPRQIHPPPNMQGAIIVTDRDGVDNNEVTAVCINMTYGTETQSCDGFFSVIATRYGNVDGRYLFTVYALRNNYMGYESFTLEIQAKNVPKDPTKQPTLVSITQNVLITNNDTQNMNPKFDQNALFFEMYEDLQKGAELSDNLREIGAFDQDVRDPNAIRFELMRDPEDPVAYDEYKFYLGSVYKDPNSAYYRVPLLLNNTIDRESIVDSTKQLHLLVKAIEYDPQNRPDRNPMTAESKITIRIMDVNDQTPTFDRNVYNISKQELRNPSLNPDAFYQISNSIDSAIVKDQDSTQFNSFDVNIISGNETGLFDLNKISGSGEEAFILYAKEKILDYETPPNFYRLKLRARDANNPSFTSEATINIYITDVNDHVPKFDSLAYSFNVDEGTPVGTTIGQVRATDEDSGDFGKIVSYNILNQQTQPFYIDTDGYIYVNGTLDHEQTQSYFFSVRALDGGTGENQRANTVPVFVSIVNLIDLAPVWLRDYYAQLTERSYELIPSLIIKATSEEEDSAGQPLVMTYSVESVQPQTIPLNTFSVNRLTGNVTVNRYIDYNDTLNGTVAVTFRATAGTLYSTKTALITIIDLNNYDPVFQPTNTFNVSISENAKPNYEVIKLSVTDEDGADTKNGKIIFQILSGANDDFLITPDSGIIKVTNRSVLDIERRQETYVLIIQASDQGNPWRAATATVTISLKDANNKDPVFKSLLYTFQINEGNYTGRDIGNVSATDLDKDSVLSYDIDYNSVVFKKNTVRVTSEVIDPTTIVRMVPHSGLLKVNGFVDRQKYDRLEFKVIVEDTNVTFGQPRQTATASVVIFVQADIDPRIFFNPPWTQAKPVITKTFSETSQTITQIMSLLATDPVNPEKPPTFRKIPSSDPQDYFYINDRVLFSQKPLDYEAINTRGLRKLTCIVEAISQDQQRTSTATIEIIIQDLNDNYPTFARDNYTFYIAEDKAYAKEVGRIRAQDRDSSSYGQVEFFLRGSHSDHFYTYIDEQKSSYNPQNGSESEAVIIVAENVELDFETLSSYSLLLYAKDNPGGENNVRYSSSVAVEIIVIDVNDMNPAFKEKVYEFTIIGTQAKGGDVGFVMAEDGDAGRNGEVTYHILSATNEGNFYFDVDTKRQTSANFGEYLDIGRIFVRNNLGNLPDRSLFELNITARDRGANPRSGHCLVKITVSKGVQDLKPKWDERLLSRVQIEEEQPVNTYVTTVTAYAADAASSIIYSFVGTGDSFRDFDSFSINRNTGVITTNVVLDMEKKRNYNLLILATDSLNSTLTNQFLLTVQVIDVNDNDPSFLDCEDVTYNIPEKATVKEEQSAGVFVFQAVACDLDEAPHDKVKYAWYRDNEYCLPQNLQHFNLDEYTGVITTKVRLDRERKSEYLLCVEAFQDENIRKKRDMTSDLEDRTNHDTVLYVLVTVQDVNDLGPKFLQPSVKTVILKYPAADVSVAEAEDEDLPPNNGIRYSIDSIKFIIDGKPQNAPTAFTVNGNDGTISIGTNDYSDYVGGYFDITIRADDYNGVDVEPDTQLQRVYVTDQANRIRVVIRRPADEGVDRDAKEMIRRLNALDDDLYYEIKTISYHVTSNNEDPRFDMTDVCMLVVRENSVLSSVSAAKQFNDVPQVQAILEDYGAIDPGPCDPAASVYPVGWESYWWVLVAFAIFIFICCVILIFIICQLFRSYKQYMESRQTYLVPGNSY